MTTYSAGTVTVSAGNVKVTGLNTQWLEKDIQAGDVLNIDGQMCEIESVNKNTELTLCSGWPGLAVKGGIYTILKAAAPINEAALAAKIFELINTYGDTATFSIKFKKAGLRVDEHCNVYQTKPDPEAISEGDYATADEIHSLIHDVMD